MAPEEVNKSQQFRQSGCGLRVDIRVGLQWDASDDNIVLGGSISICSLCLLLALQTYNVGVNCAI